MSKEIKVWERLHVVPFEVKQLEEKSDRYEFKGYASVFHKPDRARDIMHPGAFKRTIDHNKGKFPIDWMHENKDIIGGAQVYEDKKGLVVEPGYLIKGIQKADEAYKLMKAQVIDGMSFMYKAIQKNYIKGFRHLHEVRVGSLTVGPSSLICHPDALITDVKFWEAEHLFDNHLEDLKMILFDEKKIWEDNPDFAEVRFRKRNPDLFIRLRSFWLPGQVNSIRAIGGPTEAGGPFKIQALRFLRSANWTLVKAQVWEKEHRDELKFYDITLDHLYEMSRDTFENIGPIT